MGRTSTYTIDLAGLHATCEGNYVRLLQLFPDYETTNSREFQLRSGHRIRFDVVERSRYTTIMTVNSLPDPDNRPSSRSALDCGGHHKRDPDSRPSSRSALDCGGHHKRDPDSRPSSRSALDCGGHPKRDPDSRPSSRPVSADLSQPSAGTLGQPSSWLVPPRFTLRAYHDVRMVEVTGFQASGKVQARYDYPNPRMYAKDEKTQQNLFLAEWLAHCMEQGYSTDRLPAQRSARLEAP